MFQALRQFVGNARWAQVGILSAMILVVAAMAGASPGSYESPPVSTEAVSTSDELSPTPSPAPEPSAEPTAAPSPEASPTSEPPADTGDNHGRHVSRVAKCVPPGPGHGQAVREMAQTHENEAAKADEICSRYATSSDSADDSDDSDADTAADHKGKPSKAGGNGGSRGRGKKK